MGARLLDKKCSRIHKQFFRDGPNHRAGADVSFFDIVKIFGFKTATIGAWVTEQEQQIAANLFFDAFCDLMSILDVPKQVISLNGTLSLAFGIGGHKHASAHYNSASRTLALAKNAGGGALSHEWFHAFDHYITTRLFADCQAHQFASELWLKNAQIIEHPINTYLQSCFQHIFLSPGSNQTSRLFQASVNADKTVGTYYYSRPQELCARAFEACIQDQPIKNAFLVQGTKQSREAKLGIYPSGEQRSLINVSLLTYFKMLGYALNRQSLM